MAPGRLPLPVLAGIIPSPERRTGMTTQKQSPSPDIMLTSIQLAFPFLSSLVLQSSFSCARAFRRTGNRVGVVIAAGRLSAFAAFPILWFSSLVGHVRQYRTYGASLSRGIIYIASASSLTRLSHIVLSRACIFFAFLLLLFAGTASAHINVTLHFTRSANGSILVPAKVDGHSGVFVLDTGAMDSFVSAKLLGRTYKTGDRFNINIGGKGTFAQIQTVLSLGQDDFSQPMMMGSTENLTALAKTRIDGIIGLNVLSQYQKITLDFKTQTLTLEAK